MVQSSCTLLVVDEIELLAKDELSEDICRAATEDISILNELAVSLNESSTHAMSTVLPSSYLSFMIAQAFSRCLFINPCIFNALLLEKESPNAALFLV